MSIFFINKFGGQLGNQLLTYNNLCQLSGSSENCFIIKDSEIPKFFKNIKTIDIPVNKTNYNGNQIRSGIKITDKQDIVLTPPFMGNLFFYLTKQNPRKFLELKEGLKETYTWIQNQLN